MADQTDVDIQAIKPKSGLVPIILGINSVALIAVLAVVLLRSPGGASAKSGEEGSAEAGAPGTKVGPTLRLADFTARLHGIDTDRYARLSIEIEVPTEKERDELSAYMPQIRDGFISYLADSTLDDFTGSAALAKTREKLTERLHQVVPTQKIRALYITDLVVQ
jgi:flagellar basal body-associated protein FliL